MYPPSSPFLVFTVIAAPAVLTNAASILSLTTSNRIARVLDRSREILALLAADPAMPDPGRSSKIEQIELLRNRAALLVRALSAYQFAVGSLASATLVALLGSALHSFEPRYLGSASLLAALACASVGVGGIALGAWRVVQETRLSYRQLQQDTVEVLESLRSPILPPPHG